MHFSPHQFQMKLRSLIFMAALIFCGYTMNQANAAVVLDDDDGSPLPGVTLLHDGIIVGITDDRGAIMPDAEYPLMLRSLGYQVKTVAQPADTIWLTPANYMLHPVSVVAADRPIRRVLCYAREYSTGHTPIDSLQLYSEYMFEAFLAENDNVKGYKSSDAKMKVRAQRRYARVARPGIPDSVYIPAKNDEVNLLAWGPIFGELPKASITESDAIREGATGDSVPGKYAIEKRMNKNGRFYTVATDALSNEKNHCYSPTALKLLGLTVDITRANNTLRFQQNSRGVYDIYDMAFLSLNMSVLARGKMFKWIFKSSDPVEIHTGIEIYPVEITSHTIDEYKEMRRDKTVVDFLIPTDVLPEIPAAAWLKQKIVQ